MSKPWTIKEDQFLVAYFEAVGDYAGTHDLGRPAGSATKRVKKLKDTGLWDLLKAAQLAEQRAVLTWQLAFSKSAEVREIADDRLVEVEAESELADARTEAFVAMLAALKLVRDSGMRNAAWDAACAALAQAEACK